ncbi:MAG: hypothetical protein Kow0067_02860 [Coriobacteriia bacterium]
MQKRRSITHDLAWTAMTSVGLIVGNVVLNYFLARRGAVDVFGPYNLAKRLAAGLVPALTLGMTIGVVRFIAATTSAERRREYQWTAIAATLAVLGACTALVVWGAEPLSRLVLGYTDAGLLLSMWGYTVALALNALIYSFYRGELKQSKANWNNLWAMTGIPVLVVGLAPRGWNAEALLTAVTVIVVVWNGSQVVGRLVRSLKTGPVGRRVREASAPLLAFSLPRIPALVSDELVTAVPPLIANQAAQASTASFLLAGMSFATIVSAALQALNVVLLPRISEMHATGRTDAIRDITSRLFYIVGVTSAISVPLLYAATGDLVAVWLGEGFAPANPIVRIVILSIPAVVTYSPLRSIVDGTMKRPLNSYASILGIGLCVALSYVLGPESGLMLAAAYVIGRWIATALVVTVISARIRPAFSPLHVLVSAILALAAGFGIQYAAGDWSGTIAALARILATGVVGAGGLFAALWYAPGHLGLRPILERALRRGGDRRA